MTDNEIYAYVLVGTYEFEEQLREILAVSGINTSNEAMVKLPYSPQLAEMIRIELEKKV